MLAAIADLLPADKDDRQKALGIIRRVANAGGEVTGEAAERLRKVAEIFEGSGPAFPSREPAGTPFAAVNRAKAS